MVAYKALKEVPLDGYDPSADKTHESTDRQTPIKLEKVRKSLLRLTGVQWTLIQSSS